MPSVLETFAGGKVYGPEIRWLVVWKRLVLEYSHREVTHQLEGISRHCQDDILRRFATTGTVETHKGQRHGPPGNREIDARDELWLLGSVLDDPRATLRQRTLDFQLVSGKRVHLSAVCRALHRLGLTYQKMQHWASQRDDDAADAWLVEVGAFVPFNKMIVLDETAKDGRDLKGSFGSQKPLGFNHNNRSGGLEASSNG